MAQNISYRFVAMVSMTQNKDKYYRDSFREKCATNRSKQSSGAALKIATVIHGK